MIRSGSIRSAAKAIGLSQSAVSQALTKLEITLDGKLFDRVGKKLIINERGQAIIPAIFSVLDAAERLRNASDHQWINLRIAASTTIIRYILPNLIYKFKKIHPCAKIEIYGGNTKAVASMVENMEVDLGLIEGDAEGANLSIEKWIEDDLVIIRRSKHKKEKQKMTKEQIKNARWIMRERGSGTRMEVEKWLSANIGNVNIYMELGDSEAVWRSVALGLGISCLSRNVVQEVIDRGLLDEIKLEVPNPKRMMKIIRHKYRETSYGMQEFMALIKYNGRSQL